jgi:urea transporter
MIDTDMRELAHEHKTVCSPIAAVMAMFGSLIGMATGVACGAFPENIYFGLWGYNAALGAITVGGTHSQKSGDRDFML